MFKFYVVVAIGSFVGAHIYYSEKNGEERSINTFFESLMTAIMWPIYFGAYFTYMFLSDGGE